MKNRDTSSIIEAAAQNMRAIVLAEEPGVLIGSEDAMILRLGCSRSTVRQVARLLEREGFLKVKRGINGGYFSARPDAGTIEATVSSYLEMLDIDPSDVTVLASALWIEAMRKAAAADREQAALVADRLQQKLVLLKDNAPFDKVREFELLSQTEIFELAKSAYIKLIFDINIAFSRRTYSAPVPDMMSEGHAQFVRAWRDAKMLELSAIRQGDADLAVMAGQHCRKIWQHRIRERFGS